MLTKSVMLAYICEYTHICKSASKTLSSLFFGKKKEITYRFAFCAYIPWQALRYLSKPPLFFVLSSFFFCRCAFVCDFLGLSRTALFDVLDLYADSKLLLASLTSYFSLFSSLNSLCVCVCGGGFH